jgi:hypothetical protein
MSGFGDYMASLVPRATGYVTGLAPTATADAVRSGGGSSACSFFCTSSSHCPTRTITLELCGHTITFPHCGC